MKSYQHLTKSVMDLGNNSSEKSLEIYKQATLKQLSSK